MECTGRIAGIALSYGTGKPVVTLEIEGDMRTLFPSIEELKAADKLTIKMSKFREKRSLDANAYCWVLLGKLAEKLNIPKTDIYRQTIGEIGGNYDVVCIQNKAVDTIRDGWQRNGIGWITDTMPSKIDGCTNVILYYGSSTYDKAQMSRLINAIVEECKLQGIETRSPEELASLLGRWGA